MANAPRGSANRSSGFPGYGQHALRLGTHFRSAEPGSAFRNVEHDPCPFWQGGDGFEKAGPEHAPDGIA